MEINNVNETVKLYKKYKKSFFEIEKDFEKCFSLPFNITEDTTMRYLIDLSGEKKQNLLKSFVVYCIFVIYIFISLICYKKKKKISANIIFNLYSEHLKDKFYNKIYEGVKDFNPIYINMDKNDFFERKISLQVLMFLLFRIWKFIYYSIKMRFNFIDLILRHLRKICIYHTDIKHIDSICLVSVRDNYFNAMRYYIYKNYGFKNIMLIQGARRASSKDAKSGDICCYCDYYFGYGKKVMDNIYGLNAKYKIPIGSIPLYYNTLSKKEIKYDIVVIEDPVFAPNTITKKLKFDLLIEHICKFKNEFNDVKIYYSKKPKVHSELPYNENYYIKLLNHNVILKDLTIQNSYEALLSSNVVVFQSSTMGIEALGLNKIPIHCNYIGSEGHFSNDGLFVIEDESYKVFREKLLFVLNSENSDVIAEEIKKLKVNYMNLEKEPTQLIVDEILEILTRKKD